MMDKAGILLYTHSCKTVYAVSENNEHASKIQKTKNEQGRITLVVKCIYEYKYSAFVEALSEDITVSR
jgi:hypothetical protein